MLPRLRRGKYHSGGSFGSTLVVPSPDYMLQDNGRVQQERARGLMPEALHDHRFGKHQTKNETTLRRGQHHTRGYGNHKRGARPLIVMSVRGLGFDVARVSVAWTVEMAAGFFIVQSKHNGDPCKPSRLASQGPLRLEILRRSKIPQLVKSTWESSRNTEVSNSCLGEEPWVHLSNRNRGRVRKVFTSGGSSRIREVALRYTNKITLNSNDLGGRSERTAPPSVLPNVRR